MANPAYQMLNQKLQIRIVKSVIGDRDIERVFDTMERADWHTF